MNPYVGQRVVLNTLLIEGDSPELIVGADLFGLCSVKLNIQEKIVHGVRFYPDCIEHVRSSSWQICRSEKRPEVSE